MPEEDSAGQDTDAKPVPKPVKIDDVVLPSDGPPASATFEQVLFAVTGEGAKINLHGAAKAGGEPGSGNGWFIMGNAQKDKRGDAESFDLPYGAWDTTYFAVDYNTVMFDSWSRMFPEMGELIGPLASGRLGLLDVPRLLEAENAVRNYATWLQLHYGLINAWVNKLSSDDSEFKGKAAYLIRENVSRIAWILGDLYEQIMVDRTPSTPDGLRIAANALWQFAQEMSTMLLVAHSLVNLPKSLASHVHANIYAYLVGKGLTNPMFDQLVAAKGREGMEEYIRSVVRHYSSEDRMGPDVTLFWQFKEGDGATVTHELSGTVGERPFDYHHPLPDGLGPLAGPLDQQATWDRINQRISQYVLNRMEGFNEYARRRLARLEAVYKATKTPLHELYPPNPPPSGGRAGAGGGPNPGNPEIKFDPPPIRFDPPPPIRFEPPPELPDIGDGPDLPKIGGPDLPDPGNPDLGGGPNMPGLGEGSGLPQGTFPVGGLSGSPDGRPPSSPHLGGLPFTNSPFPGTTLPTGNGRTGPNHPGLVDKNDNPIDFGNLRTPEYPDFQPGPGSEIPPPGDIDFPGGGAGPGIDPLSGGGLNLPGGGDPDGLGGAAVGDPAVGGAGGEGWADWTGQPRDGQDREQVSGGTFGPGGLPMMPPPMIPPMMPGNQKDRERQTWLSEDDKLWGTESGAGSGVIGLPADLAKEIDEQLAPTHVHVRHVALRAKAGGANTKPAQATQDDSQQPANG